MILRQGRRRSAWESADIAEICRVEFQGKDGQMYTLRPSVYAVEPAQAVQAAAEHSISFSRPPSANQVFAYDLDGATTEPVVASAGKTRFQFTQGCHAEIHLSNEAALFAMAAKVKAELGVRSVASVTLPNVRAYASGRVSADDSEWIAALAAASGDWSAFIKRGR